MLLPKRYLRPKLRSNPTSPRSLDTSRSLYEADIPIKVHMSPSPVNPRLRLDLTAIRQTRRMPLKLGNPPKDKRKIHPDKLPPAERMAIARSEPSLQAMRKRLKSVSDVAFSLGKDDPPPKEKHTGISRPIQRTAENKVRIRKTASFPPTVYLNFIRPLAARLPFSFCPSRHYIN